MYGPPHLAGMCALSLCLHVQDVIARALHLSGGADDEFAVSAELARPSGEIGGGVVYGAVLDAGNDRECIFNVCVL
jgi:hypothetical protein